MRGEERDNKFPKRFYVRAIPELVLKRAGCVNGAIGTKVIVFGYIV